MGNSQHPLSSTDLASVLDAMREGVQIIDEEFRYVYLNNAASEHGRRPKSELVGKLMSECYPGIETTPMFALLRTCLEAKVPGSLKNEFAYPDGVKRIFELRIQPCKLGVVVLSIDVTESHKLEAQLRHAQKMEAIGRLAGSVAHDFNNLLSVILSYSKLVYDDLKPVDPIRADVDAIYRAGEKAAGLTAQLLAFSRQQVLAPRTLNLNDVIAECERMLRRLLGEDIELVTRYDRQLAKITADPGQLDQVLMNLAINSRDAMSHGGKLTIETRNSVLDEDYASQHFGVKPGQYVMLAVSDTGSGMDQETQARMFEPFFTTKDKGKGTGLGLSTVFGIVQQSGGHIWVYSEVGNGTTFKVYLPVAQGELIEDAELPEPITLQGTETILLVEDQDEVRKVALEILRRYGYHVIEAQNAGEAWLAVERHPRTIHLLLTDVVMPQISGRELAERLLKVRPDMKVLYMSGYTENAIVHHGMLDSGIAYLQKPILPETLARRAREVLDAPPRRSGRPTP